MREAGECHLIFKKKRKLNVYYNETFHSKTERRWIDKDNKTDTWHCRHETFRSKTEKR
jgi:hypothetical protein